jgi:hypothetical protein
MRIYIDIKRIGTHNSYLDGLRNLEVTRKKMIDDGELFRRYQNDVTDKQFELEIYQAQEEYTVTYFTMTYFILY